MHASREEMATLRRAIYPLTRKLAVRLARKRRHGRKGPLDFRNTVRHSLSLRRRAGRAQVPLPAAVEARDLRGRRHLGIGGRLRPLHAASRVRDQRPVLEGAGVRVHRRHRRGHALLRGRRGHRRGGPPGQHRGRRRVGRRPLRLRPRLRGVLGAVGQGDRARRRRCWSWATRGTTTTPSQSWVLKEMRHRARHVYWLNPEPRSYWDTGDSIVGEYGIHCDGVFECRNLRQLERLRRLPGVSEVRQRTWRWRSGRVRRSLVRSQVTSVEWRCG